MYIRRKVFSVAYDETTGEEKLFSTTEIISEEAYLNQRNFTNLEEQKKIKNEFMRNKGIGYKGSYKDFVKEYKKGVDHSQLAKPEQLTESELTKRKAQVQEAAERTAKNKEAKYVTKKSGASRLIKGKMKGKEALEHLKANKKAYGIGAGVAATTGLAGAGLAYAKAKKN
jgi:hypothetical protein